MLSDGLSVALAACHVGQIKMERKMVLCVATDKKLAHCRLGLSLLSLKLAESKALLDSCLKTSLKTSFIPIFPGQLFTASTSERSKPRDFLALLIKAIYFIRN